MVASTSPLRTIWPSLYRTCVMTPETCGDTVATATGVTVPSASMITGMSACRAAATPTVLGGPPRALGFAAPPGPRTAAPGWPPGPAGPTAGGRCVRYQASATIAASTSTAIALPTLRARRDSVGDAAEARGAGAG